MADRELTQLPALSPTASEPWGFWGMDKPPQLYQSSHGRWLLTESWIGPTPELANRVRAALESGGKCQPAGIEWLREMAASAERRAAWARRILKDLGEE